MGIMGMRLSKSKNVPVTKKATPSPPSVTLESNSPVSIVMERTNQYTPQQEDQQLEEGMGCHETDALYDAYQEYMEESMAQHEASVRHPTVEDGPNEGNVVCFINKDVSTKKGRDVPIPSFGVGKSYVDSMRRLVEMKHADEKKKATGVTRRLMEEVHIAKENMFIYQRLLKISPSEDVNRKNHRREFTKSRYLLDKMSRYECAPYSTDIHHNRVPWVDNF